MNAQFFQSWRGALLIAVVVTVGVSGYKAIFGPDTATRIAQARMSRLLPSGQPTQYMFNRQVAAARPFVSAQITLGQLTNYLQRLNCEIAWEAIDVDTFVMRASGNDALTRLNEEYAIQFVALDGPVKDGRVISVFNGPAAGIESMAYNRVTVSDEEIVQFILTIVSDLSPVPLP
ncbi:MAG: hypothetical protein CML29_06390 [Rhizobiales bacterium]|nr:hypothetical protein [Hyphomonas sp.]MAY61821.1 hypothetical protein [Hyphomicrobiales bacterium]MBA68221.1 hypothetical protein [Hyphomicrobiales bacterium]